MPGSITTDELALKIEDAENAPYMLDLRAPDQFERWRIEGKLALETVNIPYWTALGDLDRARRVVLIIVRSSRGEST